MNSGTDFSKYSLIEKEIVGKSMSTAGALKSVLDTAILNNEGALEESALKIADNANKMIDSGMLK